MLPTEGTTATRRQMMRLRAVQAVMVLLVGAWVMIGRSERYWPIVGWPMYDALTPMLPGDVVSHTFVRVRLRDGTRMVLRQADLVEYSRAPLAGLTINALLNRSDPERQAQAQAHLAELVSRKLGTREIDSISLSRTSWGVDLSRVPPVRLERPVSTVPVTSYAVPR